MSPDIDTNHRGIEMPITPPTWGFTSYLDGEPPLEFFTTARPQEPAYFSTENGLKSRRFNIDFSKQRIIFPWSAAQIQQAVTHIMEKCWEACKRMEEPQNYSLLWVFFDPVDLWHMGVQNAWNVLNAVYWKTQQIMPGLIAKTTTVLELWCEKMIKTDFSFRQRIFYWNKERESDPFFLLKQSQCEDLDGIDFWYLPLLSTVLMRAHSKLRSGAWLPRQTETLAIQTLRVTPTLRDEIYNIERQAFRGIATHAQVKTTSQGISNYGQPLFQDNFEQQVLAATERDQPQKECQALQAPTCNDPDDVKIYTGAPDSRKAATTTRKLHPFRPTPLGEVYYDMPLSIGSINHSLFYSPRKTAAGELDGPVPGQPDSPKQPNSIDLTPKTLPSVASQQERFNLIAEMKKELTNVTTNKMSPSMAQEWQQRVSNAHSASKVSTLRSTTAGSMPRPLAIHTGPSLKDTHLLTNDPHAARVRTDSNQYGRHIRRTTPSSTTTKCVNEDIRQVRGGVWHFQYQPCSCDDCHEKNCTVFVGPCGHRNLGAPENREKLHMLFTKFGTVLSTRPKCYGKAVHIRFRSVHSMLAAMSMNGKIVREICDEPLHVQYAVGSHFFIPRPGLAKPCDLQRARLVSGNNRQMVHRSHAAMLRETAYNSPRNATLPSSTLIPPANLAYFNPRAREFVSRHPSIELVPRRMRQHVGDLPSSSHPSPWTFRQPSVAGPSHYSISRRPRQVLGAKDNYAVSENNEISPSLLARIERLPRQYLRPFAHRAQVAKPEPLPPFTFPNRRASKVLDTAQSPTPQEAEAVAEGTATVIRRPDQARPNILQMPWMSTDSSSDSDAGYSADTEDAHATTAGHRRRAGKGGDLHGAVP
ncbi:hypothetical protein PFICI_13802 [Pestalotiopsis fici W106-1]|uniref:RRM domain-containing protein n=1 Tax=Pestalotiopsis fici (strain W106-1 / CGMCC3.15140) TaxID=1229662 RepID=W3WM95_PESFW|nr:uncharacterized protein PFICI_13802 [Pestalotiopsis fici W106-1]ETS73936.1 hypothetical protein PFICI_13802 [Pestalotiopsis fici W106-1]